MNNMSKNNDISYIEKKFDDSLDFASSIADTKGVSYKNSNFKKNNKDKELKIIKLSGAITFP